MNQFLLPQLRESVVWNTLTHAHLSVLKMFVFYALPLSVIPPVMIYYAGINYGGILLPALSSIQLLTIGVAFFLVELAMTFIVAYFIKRLGEVVDIQPAYEDSYKLAVLVPTPLWIAPVFLFIPSFVFNITIGAAALMLSAILIFVGVPSILRVEEEGHAILLSASILAVGLVAWAAMMFLTLITWSFVSSTLLLVI